jgi:hypothetical protein
MKSLNPEGITDAQLKEMLQATKNIAVIGLSPDASSESYRAGEYLKNAGYNIIPVTVHAHKILDEKCHHELNSIQDPVDIVYYFPHPDEVIQKVTEEVEQLTEQAKLMGVNTLWLHEKTRCDKAAEKAAQSGLTVVQDASLPDVHARVA